MVSKENTHELLNTLNLQIIIQEENHSDLIFVPIANKYFPFAKDSTNIQMEKKHSAEEYGSNLVGKE